MHSLEKEIRAQMRGVKISLIVLSSGGVSSAQSRLLDPKRTAALLDNGKENKAKFLSSKKGFTGSASHHLFSIHCDLHVCGEPYL